MWSVYGIEPLALGWCNLFYNLQTICKYDIQIHLYIYIYIHIHIHIYIYIYTYTYTYIYIYIHMYVYIYIYTHRCVCVCVCVFAFFNKKWGLSQMIWVWPWIGGWSWPFLGRKRCWSDHQYFSRVLVVGPSWKSWHIKRTHVLQPFNTSFNELQYQDLPSIEIAILGMCWCHVQRREQRLNQSLATLLIGELLGKSTHWQVFCVATGSVW